MEGGEVGQSFLGEGGGDLLFVKAKFTVKAVGGGEGQREVEIDEEEEEEEEEEEDDEEDDEEEDEEEENCFSNSKTPTSKEE